MVDWGSLAQATNQLGFGIADIFTKRNALRKQIASQEKMNRENVEAQLKMNDQNIAFQREVNDLMRQDNASAIQTKKRDLQLAGYSTADPSLQGSSVASLTAPRGEAPVVQSEFTPEMAQMYGSMFEGLADRMLNTHKIISDIQLSKAQARAANAGATGQEIENDWKDAELSAQYTQILQNIENMKSQKQLTDKQANNATMQFQVLQATVENLSEDAFAKQTNNATLAEKNMRELKILDETLSDIQARVANTKADTSVKNRQAAILDFEKRIKSVEADFAEMGINFNGTSMMDSLLRIIASPRGHELVAQAIDYLRKAFSSFINYPGVNKDSVTKGVYNDRAQSAGIPND